jgi:cholesterol oxidase
MKELIDWLRKHAQNECPKFIVSPSILLPRRLTSRDADVCGDTSINPAATLLSDAWDGYPATLHTLLAEIARLQPRKLVFLSGDEHRGCVADVEIHSNGMTRAKFISIHSPALYAPFPFANGSEYSLARNETFPFSCPETEQKYACAVNVTFPPPGDGFVHLKVAEGSRLTILFAGASGPGREIVRDL